MGLAGRREGGGALVTEDDAHPPIQVGELPQAGGEGVIVEFDPG